MNTDNIAVVIPALNEEACIAGVVSDALDQNVCEVFVIDDFSTDKTAERAEQSGATAISLASPLGAWGAAQTGIRFALQRGHSIVITMDADGQHPADALTDLIEPIRRGEAHFTIGKCPARGSSMRQIAWWILKRFSGLRFADLTSGLRAYNHGAASLLASRQASFLDYQDVGVLVLLRRHSFVGQEVPVTMRHRVSGRSKIFSSWAKVIFYMAYSSLLALSKRGSRNKPPQLLGPTE
ncbi:glycosyltransferase family 2 protein [Luminiphilus sp.]|nr:glycosyltransferase family 2 protein [Luminiphilus sp.]MDA9711260.1 glycosyltransferase family 2 protein [Luminiphilus sp.]